ncbi:hypothetical protein Egran_02043 [Elaphomyces granulatus]|uniref:Anaphase-promoting complex subunit 4 WD40 domain-containing protein n=1 Tax=Elaphomyces granulatus TaxID=519963 RepID=A0A232M1A5_9EURO|nr:hypothetical protein Egran_02043 [Elaphomyces granulatus]
MAKRKRDAGATGIEAEGGLVRNVVQPDLTTIQIVTGTYERVLHGFTVTIPATEDRPAQESKESKEDQGKRRKKKKKKQNQEKEESKDEKDGKDEQPQWTDTFLFQAHASAIRCLGISPPSGQSPQRRMLASGGTDERINLYTLSAHSPPPRGDDPPTGNRTRENPQNRELGSLLHHAASISALSFVSRYKLLAAAEDNVISVTRTRDGTVMSTIRAPRPKVQGRPSGDTAPLGGSPAGINDVAVHPSQKLMLSVGKGERCMRLWNLVTGKKAGVLNFSPDLLRSVTEGKRGTGEGRRIAWSPPGDEFVVAFEWGAVVFGTDAIPKCKLVPTPRSKLHRVQYLDVSDSPDRTEIVLALSTDDGRLIFYSTSPRTDGADLESTIPDAPVRAQLGGPPSGLSGRVKDFAVLNLTATPAGKENLALVTGSSDGAVRLWRVRRDELSRPSKISPPRQVGKLLATYETGHRITCLVAFVMQPPLLDTSAGEEGREAAEREESEESEEE